MTVTGQSLLAITLSSSSPEGSDISSPDDALSNSDEYTILFEYPPTSVFDYQQ